MQTDPVHVAVIIGSDREGRFADVVADWFLGLARQRDDLAVDAIDLAELSLPARLPAGRDPAVAAYGRRVDAADAVVVITPEYNHSFPASLKQAVDVLKDEWAAKPVGFVSYGGGAGGQRAVEHLRQVFAELRAVTVRDTVGLPHPWQRFGDDGRLLDPAGPEGAVATMLDALVWWATTLRAARAA